MVLQNLTAQQVLTVIRANSKNVKIEDGHNYKPDYWVIFPETKPDVYYLDLPRKTTHLKFTTDIDSISFVMNYGETKDFIVLLNGKDSCYTQISANYPKLKLPKKSTHGNDTIPFILKDNRIYFKGSVNGSEPLNIQFDLGADAVNINKKSVKKLKINFDKTGILHNSHGANEVRLSSTNEFEIQGLQWSGIEMYETKNMKKYEDVIIGNSFFLDQIYKIDYDHQILILFAQKPEIESGFIKQDMILDQGVRPVFEATLTFNQQSYKDWFLFDTGNTGNGILGKNLMANHHLETKFVKIIPQLVIANHSIPSIAMTGEKFKKGNSNYKFGGLIGNKILRQFNVIIDNRDGFIYLKPN